MSDSSDKTKSTFPDDMYDPQGKIPGSTMTPSTLATGVVRTGEIEFTANADPANTVSGVSHDYLETSHKLLPSSKALYEALMLLRAELQAIDPNNNFFKDNTVISQELLNSTFADKYWGYTNRNWTLAGGKAVHVSDGHENFLKVPNAVLTSQGYYFLVIDVQSIASGKLVLYDYADRVLGEITTSGVHYFEVYIANTNIFYIKMVAEDVFQGDRVVLNRWGVHFVTSRFYNYLGYRLRNIIGGEGDPGLTEEQVQRIVDDTLLDVQKVLMERIDGVHSNLLLHKNDTDNPHKDTPESIGAAAKNHDHPEFKELFTELDRALAHVSEEGNAHHAVPSDIGAADADHNHDARYSLLGHIHEQYTTEEIVNALVVKGIADYFAGIDPEEPDIVVKEPDPVYPVPHTLSNPAYVGSLPPGAEVSTMADPIALIVTDQLLHTADSDYDYYEGFATTNKVTMDHHPVRYAFKQHLTPEDRYFNVAAFYADTSSMIDETVVTYTFFTKRKVSGYTIFNDETGKVLGHPTRWKVYVDDVHVSTQDNTSWAILGTASQQRTSFAEPVSGMKFSFVVDRIRSVQDEETKMYPWGFRIVFDFLDAQPECVSIPHSLDVTMTPNYKFTVKELSTKVEPCEVDTPRYLYLKMTKKVTIDTEAVTATVDYLPSLQTSVIPPEMGPVRHGIPLFEDRFQEKEHHILGAVTIDNEDVDHPVQNIYSSQPNYCISKEDTDTLTITHTLDAPMDVVGHQLLFMKELKDSIPDAWEISYHCRIDHDDGTSIYTDIVVNEMTKYYPYLTEPVTPYLWNTAHYEKVYPNVDKITLTLISKTGPRKLSLAKFLPMFGGWYYNPYTGDATDPMMQPLGKLEYIRSAAKDYNAYRCISMALGRSTVVPVDNFATQPASRMQHVIPNPYLTTDITVTPLCLPEPDGHYYPPVCDVESITIDSIVVSTASKRRYAIKVHRLW